jgi:hypothetical protein
MTPSRAKIHVFIVVLALACLAACTPTRPPVDELDAAGRALGAARAADAPTLAPLEYRSGSHLLDQARAAEGREDYDVASELARESAADSELASAKARLATARGGVERLKADNASLGHDLDGQPAGDRP